MDSVEDKGFIPPDFVESETNWFYNELGIDDMYFQTESVDALVHPMTSSNLRLSVESDALSSV